MKAVSIIACLGTFLLVIGCMSIRQQDLDAWVGKPVEALDTHSFFITLPMVKTVTDSGIEIRDYVNKSAISQCAGSGFGNGSANSNGGQTLSYANFNAFQNCTSGMVECDNIFYIKNKKIIVYKPVGQCYTDESMQPEATYLKLVK
jgi:hypothetical protein